MLGAAEVAADQDIGEVNAGEVVTPGKIEIFSVPEPSRIVLLGIGVILVGFTYRSAWVGIKRKRLEEQARR